MALPSRKKFRGLSAAFPVPLLTLATAAAIKSGYSSAVVVPPPQNGQDGSSSSLNPLTVLSSAVVRAESPGPNVASKSVNMITPRDKRKSSSRPKLALAPCLIVNLPEALLLHIFSFFVSNTGVEIDDYLNVQAVDSRFHSLINSCALWRGVPQILPDGALNMNAFSYVKQKNKGTEGFCFKARRRCDNCLVAFKRARVYPTVRRLPSPLSPSPLMTLRMREFRII
jgi:hypothetical protein